MSHSEITTAVIMLPVMIQMQRNGDDLIVRLPPFQLPELIFTTSVADAKDLLQKELLKHLESLK